MSREKILAGNWKMNFGPKEAFAYFEGFAKSAKGSVGRKVLFLPAYLLTKEIQIAAKSQFELGAQNVHWTDSGAFTGELSGKVIQELGFSWVLIAHSERRQFFGETEDSAGKRLLKALELGLNVVYCLGETLAQRDAGKTFEVLDLQLETYAKSVKAAAASRQNCVAIAYEPVWAIGTGRTATSEQAAEAHAHIRKTLTALLGSDAAEKTPVLYGGSVTAENAKPLRALPNIDGVLVGGASLKPEVFAQICS